VCASLRVCVVGYSRQVTWIGYPNTIGLRTMQYRVTDSHIDAPDSYQRFSEKLYRLPRAFLWCVCVCVCLPPPFALSRSRSRSVSRSLSPSLSLSFSLSLSLSHTHTHTATQIAHHLETTTRITAFLPLLSSKIPQRLPSRRRPSRYSVYLLYRTKITNTDAKKYKCWQSNGCITFGSFSPLSKIQQQCFDVWLQVLAAVPTARICLKAGKSFLMSVEVQEACR
jgi:hypothetical protein